VYSGTRSLWDTPLAQLLPVNMATFDDNWVTSHVTVRDVMLHRTGVSRSYDELWIMKAYERQDVIRYDDPPMSLHAWWSLFNCTQV